MIATKRFGKENALFWSNKRITTNGICWIHKGSSRWL